MKVWWVLAHFTDEEARQRQHLVTCPPRPGNEFRSLDFWIGYNFWVEKVRARESDHLESRTCKWSFGGWHIYTLCLCVLKGMERNNQIKMTEMTESDWNSIMNHVQEWHLWSAGGNLFIWGDSIFLEHPLILHTSMMLLHHVRCRGIQVNCLVQQVWCTCSWMFLLQPHLSILWERLGNLLISLGL